MQSTVLILGARGRLGLATARAFAQAGWRVLGQMRPGAQVPSAVATDKRIQWLAIDLHHTQALVDAAGLAQVVVHAISPAYTNKAWQHNAIPLLDCSIAITQAFNATLMFPGNVYNFGADMPQRLLENTAQAALTVKGQVRIAMEARLHSAGIRCVVIRAGDFFGSGRGTWFDSTIVKNIAKGVFTYPGHGDVATAWAYLPDLAQTFVAVAEKRDQLPPFDVLHFAGYSISGQQWMQALNPLARKQGWVKPDASIKMTHLPWSVIRLGALVVGTWAALLEMRYLWDTPHALDNVKLTRLIGAEPHTPLAVAAGTALQDLGLVR